MIKAAQVLMMALLVGACGSEPEPQEEWKNPELCDCVGHMAEIFRGERESFYDGTFALIYEGEHQRVMDSCVRVVERKVNEVNTKHNFDSDSSTQAMVNAVQGCKDGQKYLKEYSAFLKNKLRSLDTIQKQDEATEKARYETEFLLRYYDKK